MSVNVQNANVNYNKGLYVNVGFFFPLVWQKTWKENGLKSQSSPVGSPLKHGT